MRRLGWPAFRVNTLSYLFDQKVAHIVVAVLTIALVFFNLTASTRAQIADQTGDKTILSSLIQSEFGTPEEEQLIEEFFDQEQVISPAQQNYFDNLSAVKSQPIAEMSPQEREQDLVIPEQNEEPILKPDLSQTGKTKRIRREVVTYLVEAGDTVSTIAEKFEISVNSVLWENNLSAYSVIRPGDQLAILPSSGVSHKVASGDTIKKLAAKYNMAEDDIRQANSLQTDGLAIGQKLFIPGGRKDSYAPYRPNIYSGLSLLKGLVSPGGKIKLPPNKKVSGNKMVWPTAGYRITQYFSWRHFAIDIANKAGTPIYAADSGSVEVSGWGRGYGNQVVIDHGGGKKTRYGHMSKTLVRKGNTVEKGQVIGLMGSTGWSTGSHLHFEVIINGGKYNPLNYVR
jgi:murein DD-endopeptidase MepM/ murein hydrolase activator NlpD